MTIHSYVFYLTSKKKATTFMHQYQYHLRKRTNKVPLPRYSSANGGWGHEQFPTECWILITSVTGSSDSAMSVTKTATTEKFTTGKRTLPSARKNHFTAICCDVIIEHCSPLNISYSPFSWTNFYSHLYVAVAVTCGSPSVATRVLSPSSLAPFLKIRLILQCHSWSSSTIGRVKRVSATWFSG